MISTALNGICPYFTMFPLDFPMGILKRHAKRDDIVLDPFSGRGTTLYAGRLSGLHAFGIDSNPVAVAISQAKLANTTPNRITTAAKRILAEIKTPNEVPTGKFWKLAFYPETLEVLCRLREGLFINCRSDSRKALRAVILGALHGPLGKELQSYFSNQCPRTYAPKPRYAVKFWRERKFLPPRVDVHQIIERRAKRFFESEKSIGNGRAIAGDSQKAIAFRSVTNKPNWIVTSPPYYGMNTYIPDQWLRRWFLGGPSEVDYANDGQLSHTNQKEFSNGLKKVWENCGLVAEQGCRLVIRFGAINNRKVDIRDVIKKSLSETAWIVTACRGAGIPPKGRRQSEHFVPTEKAIEEYDIWCKLA